MLKDHLLSGKCITPFLKRMKNNYKNELFYNNKIYSCQDEIGFWLSVKTS